MQETWTQSLGWEDPLDKGMATHSSILAWRITWTVQSMGSQRVRHDWAPFPFTSHFHCKGRREWMIGVTEVGLELTFASRSSPRSCCGNRLSLNFSPLCRTGFMSKWVSEGVWAGHAHTATFNTGTNEDHRSAQGVCSKLRGSLGGRGFGRSEH